MFHLLPDKYNLAGKKIIFPFLENYLNRILTKVDHFIFENLKSLFALEWTARFNKKKMEALRGIGGSAVSNSKPI